MTTRGDLAGQVLDKDNDYKFSQARKTEHLQKAIRPTDGSLQVHVELLSSVYPDDYIGALSCFSGHVTRVYGAQMMNTRYKSKRKVSEVSTGRGGGRGGRGGGRGRGRGRGGGRGGRGGGRGRGGRGGRGRGRENQDYSGHGERVYFGDIDCTDVTRMKQWTTVQANGKLRRDLETAGLTTMSRGAENEVSRETRQNLVVRLEEVFGKKVRGLQEKVSEKV